MGKTVRYLIKTCASMLFLVFLSACGANSVSEPTVAAIDLNKPLPPVSRSLHLNAKKFLLQNPLKRENIMHITLNLL